MECVTACMSMLLPLRGLVRATVPLCLVGDFISSNDEWPRFLSTYIWTTTDDLYNGTYYLFCCWQSQTELDDC